MKPCSINSTKKKRSERLDTLQQAADLSEEERALLEREGTLSLDTAEHMVENLIGTYSIPVGLGLNMRINDKDYAVPMATEEPSVIAAQSAANKLIRAAGGFQAEASPRMMIGQIALSGVQNGKEASGAILGAKTELITLANEAHPSLKKRGGGAADITVREVKTPQENLLVVHLAVNTLDAMGANMINTMAEAVAARLEQLSGGTAEMKILSNLVDQATATARCEIPAALLAGKGYSGEEVRDRIVWAYHFAENDIYRAATHNKGIMNGIDAVILAFGNDTRAVEAACHAYAARNGKYGPMNRWTVSKTGSLVGEMTLPMPVAAVGGSIKIVPLAKLAQKIVRLESAEELAMLTVSAGLAQNLAALRALVTEGIQAGHMSLQAKSTAISAGAVGEEIEQVAREMTATKSISLATAAEIIERLHKTE
ncbi:hydroxymethylglutaryl-CoA reductase, degradative [Listeria floridensis FSL S10-1187]|uniref:3-hydroxy-3-methylglutaryl coenzyme A reductase n=1 Tax=Listeria floridensis FSL S10-1187 TaxID=1265817 RepID=A0ABN0RBX6_9LIST|nr:hydroxymethylglutaryl-CoA reductase, degradative [Listeria floridensis FSL S10-1187]